KEKEEEGGDGALRILGAASCSTLLLLPAAPADLRDDDAVVELALAGAHAGFQHVAVDREQRQRLADLGRLVEHQVHVLEVLAGAALGAEIALDHLAALGVHHLRVGRRGLRNFEERMWLETELRREHESLGEREAVEAEDEIDGKL